jgi:hypothetical protein
MPTRKRITSREENSRTCSKSMVLVIKSTEVPMKAKLKRKSQKNKVPRIDAENMVMDKACLGFMPISLAKKPKRQDINKSDESFNKILFII